MGNEFLYMLGVVAIGAGLTYGLRALPFLLFAGRDRALPPAVERFGAFVSPVIIAALIVYSYSGLAWTTAWPYLAGLLTVGLQLWKGNPLTSIVAGTALYMCLLGFCGCASTSREVFKQDMAHPLIRVTNEGLKFQERPATPEEVVRNLEKLGVPKDDEVYVQVDNDYTDQRALWVFQHNYLNRAGYKRAILIHPRRSESGTADKVSSSMGQRVVPFEGKTFVPGQQPVRQVLPPSQRRPR